MSCLWAAALGCLTLLVQFFPHSFKYKLGPTLTVLPVLCPAQWMAATGHKGSYCLNLYPKMSAPAVTVLLTSLAPPPAHELTHPSFDIYRACSLRHPQTPTHTNMPIYLCTDPYTMVESLWLCISRSAQKYWPLLENLPCTLS